MLCLSIVIRVLVTWSVASRIAGVVVGVVAVSEQGSRGRLLSWSLSEPPTVLLSYGCDYDYDFGCDYDYDYDYDYDFVCQDQDLIPSFLFFVLGAAGIA